MLKSSEVKKSIKEVKKDKARKLLVKAIFNTLNQEKIIKKAAKESAEDQKALIVKYNSLIKVK